MLVFHNVDIDVNDFKRGDLLYVGNYFKLDGMWWSRRKQRQKLIVSVALTWFRMIERFPNSPGFIEEEVFLTSLKKMAPDAKKIIQIFFKISRLGFNFSGGDKSPTLVTPKRLTLEWKERIEKLVVGFIPLPKPEGKYVSSKVKIQSERQDFIFAELKKTHRQELIPIVKWLFDQEGEIEFLYEPAGKLQARDKSIWPIQAIETWPGWLRAELFGMVIDLENAYFQFLMSQINLKYSSSKVIELKYPDLVRIETDKTLFRKELCEKYMKLESSQINIKVVKKVLMALANGSNISGLMLVSEGTNSEAVKLIQESCYHLNSDELICLGDRLQYIARQIKAVKKDLCFFLFNEKPTLENQKKIFTKYFEWEREARYKIWNATGRTGLMLHDGIDGVLNNMPVEELVQHIENETSLRVSID